MQRRKFTTGAGGIALSLIAGCTSTDGSSDTEARQDSDDDGVPDEHDYAPDDPDVQSKSDLLTETHASAATQTRTPTASPTHTESPTPIASPTPSPTPTASPTPSPTPTPTPATTIQADSAPLEDIIHHPVEYSAEHATVRIYSDLLDNSYPSGADLFVVVQGYPDTSRSDDILSYHRSESFNPSPRGETTVSVEFDTRVTADVPIFYWFVLAPSNNEFSSISSEETDFLCETDRLRHRYGDLIRSRHPDAPGDETTSRYTRQSAEGGRAEVFTRVRQGK